jgi:hypothetical protein
MSNNIEQKVKEQRLFGESLDERIKKLEQKKEEPIEESKPFEDIKHYPLLKVDELVWSRGVGLTYGEIYAHGSTDAITSVAQNDWDQIVAFSVNGENNGTVPDHTNNHITINKKGRYLASFHWCGYGPAAAHDWDFHISKNNNASQFNNVTSHLTTPAAQNDVSVSAMGIIDLEEGDTIEMWVRRTSAGNNIVLTTDNCNIVLIKIGG